MSAHFNGHGHEICVRNLTDQIELHHLLKYFEQFGSINHYHFHRFNSRGRCLFVTYDTRQSVDRCLANRPHRFHGQHLYVKRSLPHSTDYPQEHYESVRDLLVIVEPFPENEDDILRQLRDYFSSYGLLYACKYCHETPNFSYVLIEFADYDQVDQIILDRPHYLHQYHLHVVKSSPSNRSLLRQRYQTSFDPDQQGTPSTSFDLDRSHLSEDDLESEVERLKHVMKQMNEEFLLQRKELEDQCCEQLRQLNEKAQKTHRLQQDFEKEYAQLMIDYQTLQAENAKLTDEYLLAELENFELNCHYDQLLVEERARLRHYQSVCTRELIDLDCTRTSLSPPRADDLLTSDARSNLSCQLRLQH